MIRNKIIPLYPRKEVEESYKKLCDLARFIDEEKLGDNVVLVGGWAPYFLTRDKFDHVGSKDIEIALKDGDTFQILKNVFGNRITYLFERCKDEDELICNKGYYLGISYTFEDKIKVNVCDDYNIFCVGISSILFLKIRYLFNEAFQSPEGNQDLVDHLKKQAYDILAVLQFSTSDPENCLKQFREWIISKNALLMDFRKKQTVIKQTEAFRYLNCSQDDMRLLKKIAEIEL